MIDVGAFAADPGDAKFGEGDVLSLAKHRIRSGARAVTLVVDRQPTFAGIDPYLKYIDHVIEDNVAPIKAR